jgi:hypothetical protein
MGKKQSAKKKDVTQPAQAGFIFRGTVQRVNDSTVPTVKPDASTAVVRVDEVIAAPPALTSTAGRDVTVVAGSPLTPGRQAVFHTGSLSFGQEIAVRAMSVEPLASGAPAGGTAAVRAAAAPLAATHTAPVDPVQAHRDLQLKRSLDAADFVVTGTVTDVRLAPETQALATLTAPSTAAAGVRGPIRRGAGGARAADTKTGAGASAANVPARISEHDPLWHEAVVNVESVEKGSTRQKQVVVRFPGSNDVRWRNDPKFRPGQQGVFLLNVAAPTGAGAAKATSLPGTRGAALTATAVPSAQGALQAMSEPQPISAIDKVRQLLTATAPGPGVSARAVRGAGRRTGRSTKVSRGASRSKR